jgi:cytochrome c5
MRRLATAGAGLALALGACGGFAVPDSPSVPDKITWESPVKQIMDDHCNVCHGAAPNRGAPTDFRLDTWGAKDGRVGAGSMADQIAEVVNGGEMPEEAPLGPNDTEILRKWADAGAPEN